MTLCVFLLSSGPDPIFDQIMYIVPEDDSGSVSLCVNISVNIILFEPFTFIIATAHKFPAEAEGKSIGYISSTYNHIIIFESDSDFTSGVNITIQPPGPVTCIDFSDIVVDDDVALEGNESFTIFIQLKGAVFAMVTILDDDGE